MRIRALIAALLCGVCMGVPVSARAKSEIGSISFPQEGSPSLSTPTPILSYSFTVKQTGTTQGGTGGGAGKAEISDLAITRSVDGSSPLLFKLALMGAHVKSVVVVLTNGGVAVTCTLKDAIVSSVSQSQGEGATAITETVHLDFAEIEYSAGGSTMSWNIATNAP